MPGTKTKRVRLIRRASTNSFRPGVYATIYDVLCHYSYTTKAKGISKSKLLEEVREQLRLQCRPKSDKQILYSIAVVVSARKDRLSHKSIRKHSDRFYCSVNNQFYRLYVKK